MPPCTALEHRVGGAALVYRSLHCAQGFYKASDIEQDNTHANNAVGLEK